MGQIKVMISSRCDDEFDGKKLSVTREKIKVLLEEVQIFGKQIFEVWINEDAPPQPQSALEKCLEQARESDIFLCLYNGDAGHNGICHKELEEAYTHSPRKVLVIFLEHEISQPNEEFKKYVKKIDRFRRKAKNFNGLKTHTKEAVVNLALKFMKNGAREAKKSPGDLGPALDWARMTFDERSEAMVKKVLDALKGKVVGRSNECVVNVENREVLFVPKAMPSSFSVSKAREMVGQPFLQDHILSKYLNDDVIGPVHIIACSQNITESQAMKLLGFPDAIIVKSDFGIYVADKIQRIQICFITHCFDESSTGHQVEKFLNWLKKDSGEVNDFISRAQSRTKIVKLIDKEA